MNKYFDMTCVKRLENTKCLIDDRESYYHYINSDISYLKALYKNRTGLELNISNPLTFTEKLQWLKIYWREELAYRYADKYYIPQILQDNGLIDLIPERLDVFDNASQIDFQKLPQNFVLKSSHASGYNLIVTDKRSVDEDRVKNIFDKLLRIRYYALKYEWPYEKAKPRIICEPLIQITKSWPIDYKFHCFNGQVMFCEILNAIPVQDEFEEPIELIVDKFFNRLNFSIGYKNLASYQKSPDFDNMVRYAEFLSRPFPYIRVDLLNPSIGIVKLGEFTFFPGAGFDEIYPKRFQKKIGNLLKLPTRH